MPGKLGLQWAAWSSRRHPRLLLLATAVAALVAVLLMLRVVDGPVVLYKEF